MGNYSIPMGRTIPPWRIVVEAEMERLKHFEEFLRSEDKIIFEDLMNQCKLYASYASTLASPVREVPLFISMLFAHHKMLWDHERQLAGIKSTTADPLIKSDAAPNASAEEQDGTKSS